MTAAAKMAATIVSAGRTLSCRANLVANIACEQPVNKAVCVAAYAAACAERGRPAVWDTMHPFHGPRRI